MCVYAILRLRSSGESLRKKLAFQMYRVYELISVYWLKRIYIVDAGIVIIVYIKKLVENFISYK